jgi:tetratricopeptide (TPR) repeat protein
MNLFRRWLWPRSPRSDAVSLYKEGLAHGEKKDFRGALSAYTSAIEQSDAPDDVRAMALYNRALILATDGNTEKALADLRAVIEMPILLPIVKLAARRRIERLQHRRDAVARTNRPSVT